MKKRILFTLVLCACLLLSLIGCNDGGMGAPGNDAYLDKNYGTEQGGGTADTVLSSDRKIITTVNERIETEAYDALVESLKTAVFEAGGYFVSSSYSGNGVEEDEARYASFEIRIPAESLAAFTSKVGTLGTVLSYKETANDVTLAYVDIESRIAVLEAEETALLSILANASSTADVLAVRASLSSTQSELASLRAQKTTYDTLVAYSTVHLSVNEVSHARAADGSFFSEVGDEFMQSLSAIGGFFRGVGVFLLGSSPILLLIAALGVGIFFLARAIFRRESKKLRSVPRPEEKPKDDKTEEE